MSQSSDMLQGYREAVLVQAVKEAVEIEPLALQEEYVRCPADLALWNERYAQALRVYLFAKAELEEVEAQRFIAWRQQLLSQGEKATEALIEAHVESDGTVTAVRRALIEAEVEKVRIGGVVEAIRAKKDNLVSLGAHLRAELQGDPSLRAVARNVRTVQENNR